MQDDKKEILKNNLIALQNEVNHQPNWGVMGLANSAVAGYMAIGGQTNHLKKLFNDAMSAMQDYVADMVANDPQYKCTSVMQEFMEGKVMQNYLWQKYGKVKKAIAVLIDEL